MIIIVLIWYPKCSTCKKAKNFLEEREFEFQLRDIVLDTPNMEELRIYLLKSGKNIRKLFNTSGMKYRELGLKDKINQMSEDELLSLLASDGMLIKRPILICSNDVYIGFSEKEWSEINENSEM